MGAASPPGRLGSALMAALYAGFAGLTLPARAAGAACGCFGAGERAGVADPVAAERRAGAVCAGCAVAGAACARLDPRAAGRERDRVGIGHRGGGVRDRARLLRAAAPVAILESGVSPGGPARRRAGRRCSSGAPRAAGVLARAAVAGSAFAVAPVRYLVRPGTAWAVIGPGDCGAGASATTATRRSAARSSTGSNTCPENTYVAGWWKCTDYQGSGLCHGQGYRYYLDCNRRPGARLPRAAASAPTGDCNERRRRLQPLPLRAVQHPGRRARPRSSAGWSSASTRRRCRG